MKYNKFVENRIFIQLLTYLLKSANETQNKNNSDVLVLEILKELNDLFIKYPNKNLVVNNLLYLVWNT